MPRESVILDKLKEQLGNLPFLKKKVVKPADDAEALADEIAEENAADEAAETAKRAPTFQDKLAAQLPFLAKFLKPKGDAVSSGDSTETGIKPAATGGRNQRQKIIRGVLAAGMLYAVADTFLGGDDTTTPDEGAVAEAPVQKPKKKKRKRPDSTQTAPSETPAATPDTQPTPDTIAATPTDTTAPTPVEATPPPEQTTPAPDPAPVEAGTEPTPTPDPVATVTPDPAPTGPVETPPSDGIVAPTDGGMQPKGEGTAGDQVAENPNGGDNVDKILEDLEKQMKESPQAQTVVKEYVQPPSYEFQGRGLVYNCLGKHWACIDAGSYRLCQQNYGYLKEKTKAKECWPDSVYETDKACTFVQKAKITANTKTDFCQ